MFLTPSQPRRSYHNNDDDDDDDNDNNNNKNNNNDSCFFRARKSLTQNGSWPLMQLANSDIEHHKHIAKQTIICTHIPT